MSRIGKKPITVPGGVKVNLDPKKHRIDIEGPKGKLSYEYRPEVSVQWDESEKRIVCTIPEAQMKLGQMRAYWGTVRSRIQNMVTGVTDGYEKKLEIIGVGWNAQPQGKTLRLNIGYCHPVDLTPPPLVEFAVNGQLVTVQGPDKQAVGEFAAVIRSKRPPEPYNGKGIKYTDEIIIRKQGKVFGS
ncbi:MAG: 50S ribosomal protein L6 [Phycisphaerales bacterium]|nr:50S ribosomal protein L6 [Phycisphaerae bacterium]NNF44707.1 50S ribosomal protein L6 [Phycisphaerales bacterium]NNM25246.1 50S ribosomal protein L6 [Phycisphaerales bacterium]